MDCVRAFKQISSMPSDHASLLFSEETWELSTIIPLKQETCPLVEWWFTAISSTEVRVRIVKTGTLCPRCGASNLQIFQKVF